MLQRSTPGAQLTSASGVCRLRAPIHIIGGGQNSCSMQKWGPKLASQPQRMHVAPQKRISSSWSRGHDHVKACASLRQTVAPRTYPSTLTDARRPARTDRPGIDSQASLVLRHALSAGRPQPDAALAPSSRQNPCHAGRAGRPCTPRRVAGVPLHQHAQEFCLPPIHTARAQGAPGPTQGCCS